MQQRELFLKQVLPILKSFPTFRLSIINRRNIENSIRDVINVKSIYNALDKPDVKVFKEKHAQFEIIKLLLKENDLFKDYSIEDEGVGLQILFDEIKYSPVIFFFNEIPKIRFEVENAAIFLINEDMSKVYFCGLFDKEQLKSRIIEENRIRYFVRFN